MRRTIKYLKNKLVCSFENRATATKAEVVATAVAEVQARASLRGTAVTFGIPRSTLNDHMTSQRKQVGKGGPTVLTHDEE